jgi:hypothetical protein
MREKAYHTTALERVEDALRAHGCRNEGRGSWTCPAHEDMHASLSVDEGEDGRALLKCHRGCAAEAIVEALGLELADLFLPRAKPSSKRSNGRGGRARQRVAEYLYTNAAGTPLARKVRFAPKAFNWEVPDGAGGWRPAERGQGNPHVLYRVPDLAGDGRVHLCEGEKAADRLYAAGALATCSPTTGWASSYSKALRGRDVVAWQDRDAAGADRVRLWRRELRGVVRSLQVVQSRTTGEHDDAFDHLEAGYSLEEVEAVTPAAAVELAGLLEDVEAFLERYVVFASSHQRVAVTLWAAVTHVFQAFECVVYLAITSAEKRSGKTRLLDALELLVARAWRAVLPSEAIVYRHISEAKPTLLLDEVDTIYGKKTAREHEGLRALLNAGFRARTTVPRCVGQNMEVRHFEVYCPKALAGIGDLPDTVQDRSIPIRLARRKRSEPVERFRHRAAEAEAEGLRERLGEWASTADLEDEPEVPEALNDRVADGWEALLVVADLAGANWPERARAAALALHGEPDDSEDTLGVRLLRDVRDVFTEKGASTLTTRALLEALVAVEDAPWGDLHGKELNPRRLASLLRPYDVRSANIRVGQSVVKGYAKADFLEAFDRYLTPSGQPEPLQRYSAGNSRTYADSEALQAPSESGHPLHENASAHEHLDGCSGCSGKNAEEAQGEGKKSSSDLGRRRIAPLAPGPLRDEFEERAAEFEAEGMEQAEAEHLAAYELGFLLPAAADAGGS